MRWNPHPAALGLENEPCFLGAAAAPSLRCLTGGAAGSLPKDAAPWRCAHVPRGWGCFPLLCPAGDEGPLGPVLLPLLPPEVWAALCSRSLLELPRASSTQAGLWSCGPLPFDPAFRQQIQADQQGKVEGKKRHRSNDSTASGRDRSHSCDLTESLPCKLKEEPWLQEMCNA